MLLVLKCEHCSKTLSSSEIRIMIKHEKECDLNPENKTCMTCKHRYNNDTLINSSDDTCAKGLSFSKRLEENYTSECPSYLIKGHIPKEVEPNE